MLIGLVCSIPMSDTPISALFPYLLAAFPNALVLHSTRDALAWVPSRREDHKNAAVPLSWLFEKNQADSKDPAKGAFTTGKSDDILAAFSYSAEVSFVRCMVPADQYFELLMSSLCDHNLNERIRRAMGVQCTGGCRMGHCNETLEECVEYQIKRNKSKSYCYMDQKG